MFAQMKRKGQDIPCPCNNTCLCHKPIKIDGMIYVLCFFVIAILFISYFLLSSPSVRHIQVNGQDCVVERKIDGITGTGAPYGYDIAVCPKL